MTATPDRWSKAYRPLRPRSLAVARDAVRYVWPASRDALTSLLEDSPLPAWLADPPLPTTVVIAGNDQTVPV